MSDKRNVKTISICLQPDDIERLRYLQAYSGITSRSALIAACIQTTEKVAKLQEEYNGHEIKE